MNEILEVYGENLIEMLGVIAGISLVIVLAAKTDGNNISAKPTINVWDAAVASGTWRSFKIGIKGVPNTWNIVVYSAIIKASVARQPQVKLQATYLIHS